MTRIAEKAPLIWKDESYAILGACVAVYKDKGCGFLEPVYHECLEIELDLQGILFLSNPRRPCSIAFEPSFKPSRPISYATTKSFSNQSRLRGGQ